MCADVLTNVHGVYRLFIINDILIYALYVVVFSCP